MKDDEGIAADAELISRRDFLHSLKKWSKAVIGGVLLGGLLPTPEARADWVNRRGGGGGSWVNGGRAWVNSGGSWVNRGGSWINGGGGWVNRGGGSWVNGRGGGGWVNRRGGGSWVNR